MNQIRIVSWLEWLRWAMVVAGFVIAGYCWSDPVLAVRWLTGCVVLALAGLTGIESIFFADVARQATGYAASRYQLQSGCNNLAVAMTAGIVLLLQWPVHAVVAVMTVNLLFLLLSGVNHLLSAWRDGNRGFRSYQRPIAALLLVVCALPYLLRALAAVGS